MDVLLIDTAGRLHSRTDLMDELAKMRRVVQKLLPEAPHDCWIVLDATTGQNALNQMDVFRDKIGITGLIVTKLDGTARGGVVVGLADRFRLPIVGLGTGESLEDFESFDAKLYAEQLFRPLS
jgi:fused signal recognition particle receptor